MEPSADTGRFAPEPSTISFPEDGIKVTEARKILELPEKSPLLDYERINQERKKAADEFVKKKVEEQLLAGRGFIDRNKKEEPVESDAEKSSFTRIPTVKLMKLIGLPNADEVIKTIESAKGSVSYSALLNRGVISNLRDVPIEVLERSLQRIKLFGYLLTSNDFNNRQVVDFLKVLGSADEATIKKVCDELNPYFFLSSDFLLRRPEKEERGKVNPEVLALNAIIENGGLTAEQKQRLDQLQRLAVLTADANPPKINEDGEIDTTACSHADTNLDAIFKNNLPDELVEQITLILEDGIYRNSGVGYIRNLESLRKYGLLPRVFDLIKKGLDCNSLVYEHLIEAERLFSKEDGLEWAAFFGEFNDFSLSKIPVFSEYYARKDDLVRLMVFLKALPDGAGKSTSSYWYHLHDSNFFEHTYQDLLKYDGLTGNDFLFVEAARKITFTENSMKAQGQQFQGGTIGVLVFLAQNKDNITQYVTERGDIKGKLMEEILSGRIPVPQGDYGRWYGKQDHNEIISPGIVLKHIFKFDPQICTQMLISISTEDIEKTDFLSESDKKFLLKCQEVPIASQYFLLKNRGRFGTYFKDGKPTSLLFEEACQQGHLSDFWAWLTDDIIDSFPELEQSFWRLFKTLPSSHLWPFVMSKKPNLEEIFSEGRLTSAFFEGAMKNGVRYGDIEKMLTEEVIAGFSQEDRSLWRFVKTVSADDLANFVLSQKANLTALCHDGKPTVYFFEEAVKQTRFCISWMSHLITEDTINSFPPEIQPLWRFIMTSPSDIKDFIYNEREKFADYVKEGKPTSLFFENACLKVKIDELLLMLTDETIATFGPEDQIYWRFFKSSPAEFRFRFLKIYGRSLIENETDVAFFQNLINADWSEIDRVSDQRIGERMTKLMREANLSGYDLIFGIVNEQFDKLVPNLGKDIESGINDANWQRLLMSFVASQSPDWHFSHIVSAYEQGLDSLFKNPATKDFCLGKFRSLWTTYLQNGQPDQFPASLIIMSELINHCQGAGPLRHINSLSNFSQRFIESLRRPSEFDQTTIGRLTLLEGRFDKEKWSYEDRSKLYDILSDTLSYDPVLFRQFLNVFEKITGPAQLKKFAGELGPLYQAELTLLYQTGDSDNGFTPLKSEILCQHLLSFSENIVDAPAIVQRQKIEEEKSRILESLKQGFKERFGIIKVPETFTRDSIRSLKNMVTYLANINYKDAAKEQIISFYLTIMLNGQWEAFRKGEVIDPAFYFEPERASKIQEFLDKRKSLDPIRSKNLGLQPEELDTFQSILQQETENIVYGNIETIDEKLGNVVRNIKDLEDEDIYPDQIDKKMLRLFITKGSGRVNGVLAKTYQQLAGRTITLTDEEQKIQAEIHTILQENGFEWLPQGIKQIQDKTGPISMVVNMNETIEKSQAEGEIENLRNLLKPTPNIIALFNRLGEEFTPQSGVMALSQDLSYLENLIVKRGDDLSNEEKELLNEYLVGIRSQMGKLEVIFKTISDRFEKLRSGVLPATPLKNRVDEIGIIISNKDTQQLITSKMTNDMNVIIENIRACLGCRSKEANNDTNLTFSDSNKFFVTSQSSSQQQGSVADQIVFFVPIIRPDGTQEFSFVLDNLYGSKSSDILVNHVAIVYKKYRQLKKQFPHSKLSLFVTNAALSSSGVSGSILIDKLKQSIDSSLNAIEENNIEVTVPESAAGDHYVEFGGDVRIAGSRTVGGVIITF